MDAFNILQDEQQKLYGTQPIVHSTSGSAAEGFTVVVLTAWGPFQGYAANKKGARFAAARAALTSLHIRDHPKPNYKIKKALPVPTGPCLSTMRLNGVLFDDEPKSLRSYDLSLPGPLRSVEGGHTDVSVLTDSFEVLTLPAELGEPEPVEWQNRLTAFRKWATLPRHHYMVVDVARHEWLLTCKWGQYTGIGVTDNDARERLAKRALGDIVLHATAPDTMGSESD